MRDPPLSRVGGIQVEGVANISPRNLTMWPLAGFGESCKSLRRAREEYNKCIKDGTKYQLIRIKEGWRKIEDLRKSANPQKTFTFL